VAIVVWLALLNAERSSATSVVPGSGDGSTASMVRLPGHVLAAVEGGIPVTRDADADVLRPLTVTVVLRRDDEGGFQRYLKDLSDPHAPNYRRFLTQRQIARRFGPSRRIYESVLRYLQQSGFQLVERSANRLTLTVRGTRAAAEHAFDVTVGDYRQHGRTFFANDRDPALPSQLAPHVQA